MDDGPFVFNGIDASSGAYVTPPMDADTLARAAMGDALDPEELAELRDRVDRAATDHYGVVDGVDPKRLEETGWGVVFPFARPASDAWREQEAIRDALRPLLRWRQEQAEKDREGLYKEYFGHHAYRPGESKQAFLARHGAGPGPVEPSRVPYYLMLVGSPEQIPYRVQYQIDVQYAVGRVHFDTVEEYARYAESVVAAERDGLRLPREAAFFAAANPDDKATLTSARHLVGPLADGMEALPGGDWTVRRHVGDGATKAALTGLLGGERAPALAFGASHGVSFPSGDVRQRPHQGALLCQDWPGPRAWKGEVPQDFYLAADDVASDAQLHGLVAFFFACFGAGCPQHDQFARQAYRDERAEIAPAPFLAGLPQRMLGHPRGGALAVIGHVDRAWGTSYLWRKAKQAAGTPAQLAVFESTLRRLLDGHPVGSAIEHFNERYAELASDLASRLEEVEFGAKWPGMEREIASMWTAANDARGYTVVGDPAVRLCVGEGDAAPARRPPVVDLGRTHEAPAAPSAPAPAADAPAPAAVPDAGTEGAGFVVRTWATDDPEAGAAGHGDRVLVALTRVNADGSGEVFARPDISPALAELHARSVAALAGEPGGEPSE